MSNHPKPTAVSQYFRDLKEKFNRKFFNKHELPWMKAKEVDIIVEILRNLSPAYCLEWGSGFSTLMFPKLLPNLKNWQSIEHDKDWFEQIKIRNDSGVVALNLIETDNPNFVSKSGNILTEGNYADFRSYVDFPSTLDRKFDFIFIDGRARNYCIKQAYNLVTDNGVIVVHDANRLEYFLELPAFASSCIFNDYRRHRKVGGVWIGRKTGEVSEVLDINHHMKVWKKHDAVARYLFLR